MAAPHPVPPARGRGRPPAASAPRLRLPGAVDHRADHVACRPSVGDAECRGGVPPPPGPRPGEERDVARAHRCRVRGLGGLGDELAMPIAGWRHPGRSRAQHTDLAGTGPPGAPAVPGRGPPTATGTRRGFCESGRAATPAPAHARRPHRGPASPQAPGSPAWPAWWKTPPTTWGLPGPAAPLRPTVLRGASTVYRWGRSPAAACAAPRAASASRPSAPAVTVTTSRSLRPGRRRAPSAALRRAGRGSGPAPSAHRPGEPRGGALRLSGSAAPGRSRARADSRDPPRCARR